VFWGRSRQSCEIWRVACEWVLTLWEVIGTTAFAHLPPSRANKTPPIARRAVDRDERRWLQCLPLIPTGEEIPCSTPPPSPPNHPLTSLYPFNDGPPPHDHSIAACRRRYTPGTEGSMSTGLALASAGSPVTCPLLYCRIQGRAARTKGCPKQLPIHRNNPYAHEYYQRQPIC